MNLASDWVAIQGGGMMMFIKQKDMRSEPVRRVVALGESTAHTRYGNGPDRPGAGNQAGEVR